MTFSINYKKVFLTTAICIAVAFTSHIFFLNYDFIFISPLLFSITIPLTNIELISTRKKYQAFLLSMIWVSSLLFFSIFLTLGLGIAIDQIAVHPIVAVYITTFISSILLLFINAAVLKVENLKIAAVVVGVLSLTIPILTELLLKSAIGILQFDRMTAFLVMWQIISGFGTSLAIGLKIHKRDMTIETN